MSGHAFAWRPEAAISGCHVLIAALYDKLNFGEEGLAGLCVTQVPFLAVPPPGLVKGLAFRGVHVRSKTIIFPRVPLPVWLRARSVSAWSVARSPRQAQAGGEAEADADLCRAESSVVARFGLSLAAAAARAHAMDGAQNHSPFFPDEPPVQQQRRPRAYHIAAVGPNFNRIQYAVECRVALVFNRSDAEPLRLRLDALVADESQAGPPSIELYLYGRWRAACLPHLSRGVLVRVECANVSDAVDQEMHSHQLNMLDPCLPPTRAAITQIWCLAPGSGEVRHVAYADLPVAGTRPEMRVTFAGAAAPARGVSAAVPRLDDTAAHFPSGRAPGGRKKISVLGAGQNAALRRKGADSKDGEYVPSIASVWNDVTADRASNLGRKINVYGVIVEARAPCITRGPDVRSEVIIADHSSPGSAGAAFRTMALHRFERRPGDAIPFRAVGDVIRAHRVQIAVHDDHKAKTRLIQGSAKYFSTFLLWAGDTDSDEPIAVLDPVVIPSNEARAASKPIKHTVTPADLVRVNELRAWGAAFLRASTAVDRPFLKTVPEALARFRAQGSSSSEPFDLICCFEGQPRGAVGVRFYVSDGTASSSPAVPIRDFVEVLGCDVAKVSSGDSVPFEQFAPSWSVRPDAIPMWLLIRDAYCTHSPTGSNKPVFSLMVSSRTSTLIWLRANSPEVRFLKKMKATGVRSGAPEPRQLQPPVQVDGSSLGYVPKNRPQIVMPSASQLDQELAQVRTEVGEAPSDEGRHAVNERLSKNASRVSAPALLDGSSPGAVVEDVSRSVADGATASNAMKSCDDAPKGLPPHVEVVVSRHGNEEKPVTPIMSLRTRMLELGTHPVSYRLKGRICCWKAPLDLHYSCRPWCSSCRAFLTESPDGIYCRQCGSGFASYQDPKLSWAFDVQFVLEDDERGRVDLWVSGDEARVFFGDLEPANLRSPASGLLQQRLLSCTTALLRPENRLDCCVRPFTYVDESDIVQVACSVFATTLKPSLLT